jgi:hypothetical protein
LLLLLLLVLFTLLLWFVLLFRKGDGDLDLRTDRPVTLRLLAVIGLLLTPAALMPLYP